MKLEQLTKYTTYIQAAAQGLTVQRCQAFGVVESPWEDMSPDDQFDENFLYRLKPIPVLVPYFAESDLLGLVGKVVRLKNKHRVARCVTAVEWNGSKWSIFVAGDTGIYTPLTFQRKFEFLDGSPCGLWQEHTPQPDVSATQEAWKESIEELADDQTSEEQDTEEEVDEQ